VQVAAALALAHIGDMRAVAPISYVIMPPGHWGSLGVHMQSSR